jgi:hypothetical protein
MLIVFLPKAPGLHSLTEPGTSTHPIPAAKQSG